MDMRVFLGAVFFAAGILTTIACIFVWFLPEKEKSFTRKLILITVLGLLCLGIGILCLNKNSDSSSSSYNKYNQDKSGGFIGSDGKYHEDVPEFGDDVNNWMKENW